MKWTDNELIFLKENYATMGVSFCQDQLNRNRKQVISKANYLGLKTKVSDRGENQQKKNY